MTTGPLIYLVKGRKTVYADGRRLILPDHFESGVQYDLSLKSALPQAPPLKEAIRSLFFGFEVLSEPKINRLCDHIAWLAPVRNVLPKSIGLICINVLAILYLIVWTIGSGVNQHTTGVSYGGKIALILIGQLATMFAHELAHCSSARQLGIRIDSLGAGIYLFMPAMYSKISLVAILDPRERIIVFWAGLLLQLTISPFLFAVYLLTKMDIIYSIFILNLTTVLLNMYPVARLDGYRMLMELLKSPTAPEPIKRAAPAIIKGLDILSMLMLICFLMIFSISIYTALINGTYLRDINLVLTTGIILFFFVQFIHSRRSKALRT